MHLTHQAVEHAVHLVDVKAVRQVEALWNTRAREKM
jgi:hypothetical protein